MAFCSDSRAERTWQVKRSKVKECTTWNWFMTWRHLTTHDINSNNTVWTVQFLCMLWFSSLWHLVLFAFCCLLLLCVIALTRIAWQRWGISAGFLFFSPLRPTRSAQGRRTYPEYFAVLVVAVLSGVVLPGDSELVLAHIAQARVLARLHLSYEPAGKLRLGSAGERETGRITQRLSSNETLEEHKQHRAETGRHGGTAADTRGESGTLQQPTNKQQQQSQQHVFDFSHQWSWTQEIPKHSTLHSTQSSWTSPAQWNNRCITASSYMNTICSSECLNDKSADKLMWVWIPPTSASSARVDRLGTIFSQFL